jgi:hypothetical protein
LFIIYYSTQRQPSDVLIITGTQTLDTPYTSPKESVLAVRSITVHPKYRSPTVRPWAYDLAILQLDQAPFHEDVRYIITFQFQLLNNNSSRPACLPIDNTPPLDGETCLVAGWGKTESMCLLHMKSYPKQHKPLQMHDFLAFLCKLMYRLLAELSATNTNIGMATLTTQCYVHSMRRGTEQVHVKFVHSETSCVHCILGR